jgi:hypothetical protein
MSFSFRDKPRLSDRLRGKSGDELLNELKEQFDQDRKMFFDTAPSWGSTPMSSPFSRVSRTLVCNSHYSIAHIIWYV